MKLAGLLVLVAACGSNSDAAPKEAAKKAVVGDIKARTPKLKVEPVANDLMCATKGHLAIGGALAEMLALEPVMETHVREVHQADDVALVIVDWSLRGTAPDGSAVTQSGHSADVLRRQRDGTWRVLIDHP